MAVDERLRRELEGAARPADPSGVYEELIRRRERRHLAGRVRSATLGLAVFAGVVGGLFVLSSLFGSTTRVVTAPVASNGQLAIALLADASASERIAVLDQRGADLRFLTSGGADTLPAWSPDGRQIAFWRFADGVGAGIWTMNADGSDQRLLHPTDASIWALDWSPDGTRLAFIEVELPGGSGTELDFTADLFVIGSAGGPRMPVITEGQVTDFDWSPDGSRFVIERQFARGEGRLGYDLAVVTADGSEERPITDDGISRDPAWSSDGRTIVFVGSATGRFEDQDLFRIAADGSERERLTSNTGAKENVVVAPDGSLIAYTRFLGGGDRACELTVMHADGTNARAIGTRGSLDGCPTALAWQPVPGTVGGEPTPSSSASATTEPVPEGALDLGIGTPLCDVTSVGGIFLGAYGDGQTAYVGMEPQAGSCEPAAGERTAIAAIDLTGDGIAEVASEPFECDMSCSAYAAPDVDGDGDDELLAQTVQFSVVGLQLFELVPNEDAPSLMGVTVEPPGDPAGAHQGFDGSAPPLFWIGGDGFGIDALRCEPSGGGRVLISTTAQMVPPDTPESVWEAHETTFALGRGVLRVVHARDFEEPVTFGDGSGPSFTGTGGCGADLDPSS